MSIPKTLTEAIDNLLSFLPAAFIEKIKAASEENFVTDEHFGLGRWVRNHWNLWKEKTDMVQWFNGKEIYHPDDISGIILVSLHRHLTGKEIELEEQVKHYQKYWKEQEEKRHVSRR